MIQKHLVAFVSLPLVAFYSPLVRGADLSDLSYDASGSSVTITSCKTTAEGDLVIPASIEGKPVTKIGPSAFFGCHGLTSLDTGDTVTEIGDLACFGNRGIKTLKLGRSVTQIGFRAFNSCSALESVSLNSNLRTIGDSAFERCAKIESIVIPSTVTSIGKSAFRYCDLLESIHFEGALPVLGDNVFDAAHIFAIITAPPGTSGLPDDISGVPVYTKVGSLSYRTSGETASLVRCDQDATGTQEILLSVNGKEVTRIDRSAFKQCRLVTQVNIPNTVTDIEYQAFSGCSSLKTLSLPDSVTSIGVEAFSSCTSLEQVEFGSGLTELENAAFTRCGLKSVTLPESLSRTGNSVFAGCTELERADTGDRLTLVSNSCFAGCSSLKEIVFGTRVSRIGWNSLDGCDQLESVFFRGNAPGSIRNDLFSRLASEVTVFVEPDARRFRETIGGAPIVILGSTSPEPPPVVTPPTPPVEPSVPAPGTLSISSIRYDAGGNFILQVSGTNEGVTVEYASSIGMPFETLAGVAAQGSNEIVIPSTLSEAQGTQGFFRVSRSE